MRDENSRSGQETIATMTMPLLVRIRCDIGEGGTKPYACRANGYKSDRRSAR